MVRSDDESFTWLSLAGHVGVPTSAAEAIVRLWQWGFRHAPKSTVASTVAILLGVCASLIYGIADAESGRKNAPDFVATYEAQLDQIDRVASSVKNLQEFLDAERSRIEASQKAISTLRAEEAALRPVIEAERQAIDAIFALQAEKQAQNVWWERSYGFISGVVASLLASLIWFVAAGAIERHRRRMNVT